MRITVITIITHYYPDQSVLCHTYAVFQYLVFGGSEAGRFRSNIGFVSLLLSKSRSYL
jgi:hypothetical protein